MDLSIIIVNWNSAAFTRKCLVSIEANAANLSYEVIVIDNASHDGCGEMIEADFPHVKFIQSTENVGFAQANNLAFAQSRGRNVLFLNPDTEILGDALQELLEALESMPQAGMVGAHLLNSDLSLQTTCVVALPSFLNQFLSSDYLRRAFPTWNIWGMRPLLQEIKHPVPVEAISGACMLAKREVIDQISGFSTDYFMYAEDMDLCMRIGRSGWKIYYAPNAKIVHHAGKSSSTRKEGNFSSVVLRESVYRYMKLHHGSRYAALYQLSSAVLALLRLALLLVAFPIVVYPKGRLFVFSAFSKWCDILSWSVGGEQWARQQHWPNSVSRQGAPVTKPSYEPEKA